jgi:caffeoyl-CoA O-methyltransferase
MPAQRYGEVKHLPISPVMRDYMVKSSSPSDEIVDSLVARTAEIGDLAIMMVPQEQAALLTMLTRMLAARSVLDIGTFTGFSALSFARGLAPGGRVLTCDVTEQWADIAREHWKRAEVEDRVDFRVAPAQETLRALPPGTTFDIAFLDADKENYPGYLRTVAPLLRPGGLLIVDNVLFNGYVLDPLLAEEGLLREASSGLRQFNAELAADQRFDAVMLPIADGLTIARRKD